MKRTYQCPHCRAVLNPGTKIVLRGQLAGRRGLFLFSPTPGNYEVVVPPGVELRKRDRVDFGCPVCGEDLTSRHEPSLAEIAFRTSSGDAGTVAFSRTWGNHETYFITREKVSRYGENADRDIMNYWGEGPEP